MEGLLRHPALESVLAELRAGGNLVALSGLHDVAKVLAAAYLTHELRRPAFFVTETNRRAEALAESLRFFAQIFPGPTGGVAVLPAFDSLPWDSQSPHADILERRAATLYRLANGEVSLVIAPSLPLCGAIRIPTSISLSLAAFPKTAKSRTRN